MVSNCTNLSRAISCRFLPFARELITSNDKKIIDIALKYGFESHDVFIRAFKRFYATTPSGFCENGNKLHEFYRNNSYLIAGFTMPFSNNENTRDVSIMENWELHEVQIVTLDEIKLIGIRKSIGEKDAFEQFYEQYDKIFRNAANRIYPNSTNATYAISIMLGNGKHDYFLGVEVSFFDNIPSDAKTLILPKQKYAVIGYKGGLDYREITDYFYDTWLSKSGYKSALSENFPFCTVEWYSPNNDTPEYEERMYIPIED